MHVHIMQYNDNPKIPSLIKHFFKLTLKRSCHGASLEKSVLGKFMRGSIVKSVVENGADVCRECYLHDTTALQVIMAKPRITSR